MQGAGFIDRRATETRLNLLLLKHVFAVDIARCPLCQEGSLRIIAGEAGADPCGAERLRHALASAPPRACGAPAGGGPGSTGWAHAAGGKGRLNFLHLSPSAAPINAQRVGPFLPSSYP